MRKQVGLHSLSPYLLLAPAVLVILGTVAYPVVYNIYLSFIDYTLTKPDKPFVGLGNYITVLQADYFADVLKQTLVWTLGNIVLLLALGLAVCMLLNQEFVGKNLLKSLLLISWILPEVVTGYAWKWMLMSDFGIVNAALEKIGLVGPDFSWFRTGSMAMLAAILANVWRSFPYMTLMLYAKLKTLPGELREAAEIDGATRPQQFAYITLPHLKPVLQRCTLLAFIWTFNAFSIIYTLTAGGPVGKTETFGLIIQRIAFSNYRFGEASALSMVMLFILMLVIGGGSLLGKLYGRRTARGSQ